MAMDRKRLQDYLDGLLPEEEEVEKQPEELDPDDGEASTEVSE